MPAPELPALVARAFGTARGNAVAAGYLGGWRMVRWMPERSARALFDLAAHRVHAADGRGVQRLRSNLAQVLAGDDGDPAGVDRDHLESLTQDAVRSYLRYWCEAFRLPSWPLDDVVARTVPVHEERVREPYDAGRGAVAALPHMANWDWAGAWACGTGMPLMTVAERLEPARLYDEFVAYRARLGIHILPLTGEGGTMVRLNRWVTGGGLVCLLADRDLSRASVPVRLAGAAARMPRGPAEIALRTGAPLLPVTLHYTDAPDGRPGMAVVIGEEVPAPTAGTDEQRVTAMMQGVADAFTDAIREHPADWHMMQRVFTGGAR